MGRRTWMQIGAMTCGIALFLFALRPTEGSPDAADGVTWALSAGLTGAVVVLLTWAGSISTGPRRAALFGVASGTSFALTAVFISATLADGLSWGLFLRWQLYLVAVAGLTAMVLLQLGLRAGSLVAVQPGVTLSDPVVAVVLGVTLFDEAVRTGLWIIPEAIGAAAVAWGAVGLSRSSIATVHQGTVRAEDGTGSSPGGVPAPGAGRTAGPNRC
jgi:hypothetical protein